MGHPALFFGSIGTLVETSDMQRKAFNAAFREAKVPWHWDRPTYAKLLERSGGRQRIADFAEAKGDLVDAEALHAAKVRIFVDMILDQKLDLRPGVRNLIDDAHEAGMTVGFVTSTGANQMLPIFDAVGTQLELYDFAYIGDSTKAKRRKPFPDIYHDALSTLGIDRKDVIAIEDTASSARAALAAGVRTCVLPGEMVKAHQFPQEATMVGHLDASLLQPRLRHAS